MSTKIYPEVTIYAVHEVRGGVVLDKANGEVHGSQIWAIEPTGFGQAFLYARRVDRKTVDETPEAAIARFVNGHRLRAIRLRGEADECDLLVSKAEQLLESVERTA